jgi:hypothetical protein
LKGHDFHSLLKKSDLCMVLKGAGFSPYVKPHNMNVGFSPEGRLSNARPIFSASCSAANGSQKTVGFSP